MKESFVINKPSTSVFRYMWHIFLAFLLAVIIILGIMTRLHLGVLVAILILTALIMIYIDSATGSNLQGALPEYTYPNPPHLGLDGVNLQNEATAQY